MARNGSGLGVVLELLVLFAATEQLWGALDSSLVETSTQSTTMNPHRVLTGSLIRSGRHFAHDREETADPSCSSPNPSPSGTSDWATTLTFAGVDQYLMEISVGTPPQRLMAVADTGSDLIWLQCGACSSCSEGVCTPCAASGNETFEPTESSTYAPLSCSSSACAFLNESGSSACRVSSAKSSTAGCEYLYLYGDGSLTFGTLAQETITLQNVGGGFQTVSDFSFGCSKIADSNTSLIYNAAGLVGLGRGNISFTSQFGKHFGNKFGYCLVDRSIPNPSPLYFGSDAVPAAAQLHYTPMVSNEFFSTFYFVNCNGISLAGKDIRTIPASAFAIDSVGNGGMFFDSGTTFMALEESIFDSLIEALENEIGDGYNTTTDPNLTFPLCYEARWRTWTADYGKGVPAISFQLQNTTGFSLDVGNAWIQVDDVTVCLAMTNGGKGARNVVGSYQQVNFHVLYDLENEQIGFVAADCNSS